MGGLRGRLRPVLPRHRARRGTRRATGSFGGGRRLADPPTDGHRRAPRPSPTTSWSLIRDAVDDLWGKHPTDLLPQLGGQLALLILLCLVDAQSLDQRHRQADGSPARSLLDLNSSPPPHLLGSFWRGICSPVGSSLCGGYTQAGMARRGVPRRWGRAPVRRVRGWRCVRLGSEVRGRAPARAPRRAPGSRLSSPVEVGFYR